MNALLYLEFCHAKNVVLSVVRSPARLALWIGYVSFIVFIAFIRNVRRSKPVSPLPPLTPQIEVAIGGGALLLLGAITLIFISAPFRAFRSRADARLLCGSGIRPDIVVFWLELRRLAGPLFSRSAPLLVFYLLIWTSARTGVTALFARFAVILLVVAMLSMLQFSAFVVAKRFGAAPVSVGAVLIAFLGAGFAALGIAAEGLGEPAHVLFALPWTPLEAVDAIVHGRPAAIASLTFVPIILLAITPLFGREILPQLYEATARFPDARPARGAPRRDASVAQSRRQATTVSAPVGAAAVLWKDWIALRRSGTFPLWLLLCALALAVGASAHAVGRGEGADVIASVLITLGFTGGLLMITAAPIRLGRDVGKPLWWLNPAPVHQRLWMWTLSKTWPIAVPVVLMTTPLMLGYGELVGALLAPFAVFSAVWSLTAVGVALYPFFPGTTERGPVGILRVFVTMALLFPAVILSAIALIVTRVATVSLGVGLGVLLFEGIVLLELCATQMGRNSIAATRAQD